MKISMQVTLSAKEMDMIRSKAYDIETLLLPAFGLNEPSAKIRKMIETHGNVKISASSKLGMFLYHLRLKDTIELNLEFEYEEESIGLMLNSLYALLDLGTPAIAAVYQISNAKEKMTALTQSVKDLNAAASANATANKEVTAYIPDVDKSAH